MQRHVRDDRVGALAVLHDPPEVAIQGANQVFDFLAEILPGSATGFSTSLNSPSNSDEIGGKNCSRG
jgi:hypothetical protein